MKENLQSIFNQSDSEIMVYFEIIKFTLGNDVLPLTKLGCVSNILLTSISKRIKNIPILTEQNILNREIFCEDTPL